MFGTLSVKHLKSQSDLLPDHKKALTQAKSERFSLSNGRKPKCCLHGSFQYANSHDFDNHAHSLNMGFISMQLKSSFASATSAQSLYAYLLLNSGKVQIRKRYRLRKHWTKIRIPTTWLSDHADKMVRFQNSFLWIK